MERVSKAVCAVIIVLTVIVMLVSTNAIAGGGVNWKVIISNPTEYGITAVACTQIAAEGPSGCWKREGTTTWIGAGQTVVIETGATCPCSIYGSIHIDGKKHRVAAINLGTGANTSCSADCSGTAACWNSAITVKKITPPECDPNEKYAFTKK